MVSPVRMVAVCKSFRVGFDRNRNLSLAKQNLNDVNRAPGDVGMASDGMPSYQPALLVLLACCLGIVVDRVLDPSVFLLVTISGLAMLAWVLIGAKSGSLKWQSALRSCLLLVAVASLAGIWHHARWNLYCENEVGLYAHNESTRICLTGEIASEPRWAAASDEDLLNPIPGTDRIKMKLLPHKIRDGQTWRPVNGQLDLVVHDDVPELQVGQTIVLHGSIVRIKPPSNPGQFNFQDFYRGRGQLAVVHVYESEAIEVSADSSWLPGRWISRLRHRLNQTIWRFVDQPQAALASAVLLGNREQLSSSRRDQFLMTGTVHLLAISGLHVGILAGVFLVLYRIRLLRRNHALLATIGFVLFYTWLVEFRPPVCRAAILIVLYCVGRLLGLRAFSFNWLAVAGIVVLAINPMELFGAGTQLSFLAVATIIFARDWMFWPASSDSLDRLIANTRPWPVRGLNGFLRSVRAGILVSAIIWLVAIPLVAYRFHLVAPVALIVNPVLLFPMALALYGGLGVLFFGSLFAPLGWIFGWFCAWNLRGIEFIIHLSQTWPGAFLWTSGPTLTSVLLFYAGVWGLAIYPKTKVKGAWLLGLACCWFVLGWLVPDQWARVNQARLQSTAEVVFTFVDVGHGVCVLVELENGQNLLYDAGCFGSSRYGFQNISSVLWNKRIERLDAIVISHADVDHFNAIPQLCKRFSVGSVFVSPVMFRDEAPSVRLLLNELELASVEVRQLSAGQRLLAGTKSRIEVLNPPALGTQDSDNSDSIVLDIEFAERRVLLTGDLERTGMHLLLSQNSRDFDVVLAPHHGSVHSAPELFAAWATPEWVVISAAAKRVKPEAIKAYSKNGAEVLTTGVDGAVQIRIAEQGSSPMGEMAVYAWERNAFVPKSVHKSKNR